MSNLEKRIKTLYKKVSQDEIPTERVCERHINTLTGIKNNLIDKGKIGMWDLEEIQLGGFLGASEDDISEAMDEIEGQLEKIALVLGIDLDEEESVEKPHGTPIFNINLSQNQSQYQKQHQSQSVHIESLKKELEKELMKKEPSESKVKKIINDIIDITKSSASGVITKVILKVFGL